MTKEYMGKIKDWWIHYPLDIFSPPNGTLEYIVCGTFVDHPHFAGFDGHTSYVIYHNLQTGTVETENSYYQLVGSPKREPVDLRGQ